MSGPWPVNVFEKEAVILVERVLPYELIVSNDTQLDLTENAKGFRDFSTSKTCLDRP